MTRQEQLENTGKKFFILICVILVIVIAWRDSKRNLQAPPAPVTKDTTKWDPLAPQNQVNLFPF